MAELAAFLRVGCGAEEGTQVSSLVWYPGHVDTRLNTYTVKTIAAVCKGFTPSSYTFGVWARGEKSLCTHQTQRAGLV